MLPAKHIREVFDETLGWTSGRRTNELVRFYVVVATRKLTILAIDLTK